MAVAAKYAIVEGDEEGFSPRGGALQLWRSHEHEIILSGPAETGKTYSCMQKLDGLLWKYPGAHAVVIRKTLSGLYTTVFKTYRNVIGPDSPVRFYGGQKPEWADYPNGSRLFFAGMDNPQKALSSERDFICVNQAEELSLDDWEVLTTRCTGRAANTPYAQMFGDCNPGPPTHWIKHRPSLLLLESRHEDNPTLFEPDGRITPRGVETLRVLDGLTGVRKERLRYGRWVQAEGVVYDEWDARVHVVDRPDIPADFARYVMGCDWGYTNPGSLGLYGVDYDGRMTLLHEVYRTGQLIDWWAARAFGLAERYPVEAVACDPSEPAYIAAFRQAGLPAVPAFNAVAPGIQAVKERLKAAGDGRPRLMVVRDALDEVDPDLAEARRPTRLADEMEVYAWAQSGSGRAAKEEPAKVNDHAVDSLRYACCYVDGMGTPGPLSEDPDAALTGWRG